MDTASLVLVVLRFQKLRINILYLSLLYYMYLLSPAADTAVHQKEILSSREKIFCSAHKRSVYMDADCHSSSEGGE